jgi:predicted aldo/keto reductase-like oxidoreductase
MSISRRRFMETAALGTLAASKVAGAAAESDPVTPLPTRILGRTGARVSILAFGGGSRFLSYDTDEKSVEAINRALDLGITYLDTAYGYGNGTSERRIGTVMATRRKSVFLTTKIADRNGDEAARRIEGSLKRLQTDHLDNIHIHSLTDEDDLKAIEAPDGILKRLYKLRDEKVTRFIGVTSHTDPTVLRTALDRNDFDITQMALNGAQVGMKTGVGNMIINPAMKMSFESVALPVALKKKMGVIGMKIFAADGLVGQASPEKLLAYTLTLPVSMVVVGMPKLSHIEENCRLVKAFKPLSKSEMEEMGSTLSSKNKLALDRYFHSHVDQYPA